MAAPLKTKSFTTEDYHRMVQVGILDENDRVELIKGDIVAMAPIGSNHAACVNRLNRLFTSRFADKVIVSVQNPLILGKDSEPEPDLAVLKPRSDFYAARHPGPDEVHLIVEVADNSLEYDRKIKLALYASAGIAEVWLVNLPENHLEIFSKPSRHGYNRIEIFRKGDNFRSESLPEMVFNTSEIL